MNGQDSLGQWMAAQQAASEAEAGLNRRLADYLQQRGPQPQTSEFFEVRFLRNHALELLEQALARKLSSAAGRAPC